MGQLAQISQVHRAGQTKDAQYEIDAYGWVRVLSCFGFGLLQMETKGESLVLFDSICFSNPQVKAAPAYQSIQLPY